jgi:putative membrane protein
MSNDTQRTVRFFKTWAINTFAVLIAVNIVPGITISTSRPYLAPVLTALILGILNAFIRPILMLIALPLVILTLGLFTFVINALLLRLVAWFLPDFFHVENFWAAFFGAAVIWIISSLANLFTGGSRVQIKRWPGNKPPPPPSGKSGPGDGNGPIIDV